MPVGCQSNQCAEQKPPSGEGNEPRSASSTLSSGTIASVVPSSRLTHQVWKEPAVEQSTSS
jgi:hypothetical protein